MMQLRVRWAIVTSVVITALMVGGGIYFWQRLKPSTMTVTIMVPKDSDKYVQAMKQYVNRGGDDPSKTWPFTKKQASVPYTTDLIRASAQAAAEEIPISGGPPKISIAYLKLRDRTAYVLLDIDL